MAIFAALTGAFFMLGFLETLKHIVNKDRKYFYDALILFWTNNFPSIAGFLGLIHSRNIVLSTS